MSTPSQTSSYASNAPLAVRPAEGAFRRFFREVWQSYVAHSELQVMHAASAMHAFTPKTVRRDR